MSLDHAAYGAATPADWDGGFSIAAPQAHRAQPSRRRMKNCRWCGTAFWDAHHAYCTRACGSQARTAHYARLTITPAMLAGLARSPRTRHGSHHHSAKDWCLSDPSGQVWKARNLLDFIRSHPHLFAPEDVHWRSGKCCRASVGLAQLHPDRRMKRPVASWKGWRWAGAAAV